MSSRHPDQGITRKPNSKRIGGNLHCFIIFKRDSNNQTVTKQKAKKKKSSIKKRLHDSIAPDTTTLSQSSEFAVSAVPRKEITVEIYVPKKQKSGSKAAPAQATEAEVFEKNVEAALQQEQQ